MTNDSIDSEERQDQKRQSLEGIQSQKRFLLEEETTTLQEKEKLGYGDFSISEFLNQKPDLSQDQATISRFLDIQERLRDVTEQKSVLFVEELVVEELNKRHAAVHIDRFFILTEKEDPNMGGPNFTLESRSSFRDTYENQTVQLPSGKKTKTMTKADVWLKSDQRRQYDGIVFSPGLEDNPKYYNIWKGFAITARRGCCQVFMAHVLKVICSGNRVHFDYLWKWCARLVQQPHKLAEVAIVLLGEPGTGKNTFVDALGSLLGTHYLPLDSIDQLLGKFNFHLKTGVLLHGNEALWGGDRSQGGKLKASITERYRVIEGKSKDIIIVPNFTHLILSSNEDWPVHLDRDDRRFLVLGVSNDKKEDKEYFKGIHDELRNGGLEALLYELLHEDIANFDHRTPPQTDESLQIKLLSAPSTERYVLEALKLGCVDLGNSSPTELWPEEKLKSSVYTDYCLWCEKEGERAEKSEMLGRTIQKLIPSTRTVRPRNDGRARCYRFPSLGKAREEFQTAYKVSAGVWDT